MKTLRQTCAATILIIALTVSTLAGEIDCPAAVSPPPAGTSTVTSVVLVIVNLVY